MQVICNIVKEKNGPCGYVTLTLILLISIFVKLSHVRAPFVFPYTDRPFIGGNCRKLSTLSKNRDDGMTDEQRLLERERRRIRDEQRRKNLSDEQRALEKEQRRTRERQCRNNMNNEQRAVEMERRRIRERQHRQNMDDEQRSKGEGKTDVREISNGGKI
ncbi:hypothetical protein IFM89_035442 [Coptis chinensis]|uniref:Uncharacterized protein n=1 Tax=Coptis chinensis TaxID=261450 RepID=A0A835HJB0_9MAGN|nr:hypothetical protein IFM89_035442 [Coptis chinensis]